MKQACVVKWDNLLFKFANISGWMVNKLHFWAQNGSKYLVLVIKFEAHCKTTMFLPVLNVFAGLSMFLLVSQCFCWSVYICNAFISECLSMFVVVADASCMFSSPLLLVVSASSLLVGCCGRFLPGNHWAYRDGIDRIVLLKHAHFS